MCNLLNVKYPEMYLQPIAPVTEGLVNCSCLFILYYGPHYSCKDDQVLFSGPEGSTIFTELRMDECIICNSVSFVTVFQ